MATVFYTRGEYDRQVRGGHSIRGPAIRSQSRNKYSLMSNEWDLDTVGTTLRSAMVELTAKQFDQLIVFLLKELGPTSTIEFVPADRESNIDLVVETTHPFLDVQYGVRLEQLPTTKSVSKSIVRALAASPSPTRNGAIKPAQEVLSRSHPRTSLTTTRKSFSQSVWARQPRIRCVIRSWPRFSRWTRPTCLGSNRRQIRRPAVLGGTPLSRPHDSVSAYTNGQAFPHVTLQPAPGRRRLFGFFS